ncbi:autophagy associated protein Atg3 [Schizosaccharomyces pombe]|uniref:Autophagy-related protein 3 n=1 Tax=Schizosaccharomyces pombe (strain 972 / ATCC 24843) TaxID=284812 RepID=ATG3_SCHPO|nr:autophagy-associated protein Atg3 [Schizosaccharomyces pombe]O43035.1 RecName: Full=Autophagy-related protein 3; AltName: Full=Autophagy-related E2-like conjugation enzyme atg3 [Schizosaccharomyces pombe 972h-]CAA17786.1 autophagy associated protein Atg3 [Schizosaccharomyces pombe]|eukprot:NP_596664.1 autophagy-associated protein Atg3 [Schizosaccharomyces pombe]
MAQRLTSAFLNWREHITPASKTSDFENTGMISPEEFVLAGDYLVSKFPTWSWECGDRIRGFLPKDKQYLVTRHVFCVQRNINIGVNEEWVDIETDDTRNKDDDQDDDAISSIHSDTSDIASAERLKGQSKELSDSGPLPLKDEEDDDQMVSPVIKEDEGRYYDLYIVYDKYYRTPRLFLRGWNAGGQLLTMKDIYEDVSGEHAGKTVTMEPFPHYHSHNTMASVHPCKHASVLLKLIKQHRERNDPIRVDQYMVLFLKFVSTMLPYFEIDYTIQA